MRLVGGTIEPDTDLKLILVPNKLFNFRTYGNKVQYAAYETVDEVKYGQIFDADLQGEGIDKFAWQPISSDQIISMP